MTSSPISGLRFRQDPFEAWYTTPSGAQIYFRLLQPEDVDLLIDLFHHLSPETRRRRFSVGLEQIEPERLRREAAQLANVDNQTLRGAVVALDADTGAPVGVARLGRHAATQPEAEAAVVVRDDYQRQGIGSALLWLLTRLARQMGVQALTATVQSDNTPVFHLVQKAGLPSELETHRGESTLRVPLPAQ